MEPMNMVSKCSLVALFWELACLANTVPADESRVLKFEEEDAEFQECNEKSFASEGYRDMCCDCVAIGFCNDNPNFERYGYGFGPKGALSGCDVCDDKAYGSLASYCSTHGGVLSHEVYCDEYLGECPISC
jgi:hypothetical protein